MYTQNKSEGGVKKEPSPLYSRRSSFPLKINKIRADNPPDRRRFFHVYKGL